MIEDDTELDTIINSMHMSLSKLQEIVKDREAWHAAVPWVSKSWIELSDRTIATNAIITTFITYNFCNSVCLLLLLFGIFINSLN